jgi:alpha-2-macroglobulin
MAMHYTNTYHYTHFSNALALPVSTPTPAFPRTTSLSRILVLAMLGAALTGCRQRPEGSQGVELVLNSEAPAPATTFELRFDTPMVAVGQVGMTTTNPPLLITPGLAGAFTWLSPRSGVFAPTEPLALDTHYDLSLRPGLRCADGHASSAWLHRTLTTPAFGVVGCWPKHFDPNAPSELEAKLAFNADIRPQEALPFIYFRDAEGRRIPADVRQGVVEDPLYELGGPWALRAWKQQFDANRSPARSGRTGEARDHTAPGVANMLVAAPRQPLTLGKGWRLVVEAGAPARDCSLRLREPFEVPIGDVTPFVVTDANATHYVHSGARIQLSFSKPIPELPTNGIAEWMEISPTPPNLVAQSGWRSVVLKGDFKGDTWYTVKLLPGFHSTEPFNLSGSNTFTLKMPRVAPRLYFPAFSRDQLAGGSRTFPLLAVNVPQARVRAKLLDPQTAIHALRGYGSYFVRWDERRDAEARDEQYRRVNYNLVPGRTVFTREILLEGEPDAAKRVELNWDEMLAGRKAGVVFLDAERAGGEGDSQPRLGAQALIQLTDLGLIWKKAHTGVDVFVFSHASGQPVAGAKAQLFSDENELLREKVTDSSGRAFLQANTNAEWVAVQLGDDFHAALLKEDRVWLYRFDLPCAGSDEPASDQRVLLFSDRDVYRPGEDLHLAALVREWGDEGLRVPVGVAGTFDCVDNRGRQFFQTNAVFGPAGSWSVDVPLSAGSRGTYFARLHLGTNEYPHGFQVQDFQPSAFEIELKSKAVFSAGEKIELPVSARYLFGKQLSGARVAWSLDAEDTEFRPERFSTFTFRRTDPEARSGGGQSSPTFSGQGLLTGTSNLIIAPDLPVNAATPQPRAASLLVEVTDLNQQTLSHSVGFVRHSSDFYLGLRQATAVLTAGQLAAIEMVAVRPDGLPWPESVSAQLTLKRIDWQLIRIQGAGRSIRYRNEAVITNVPTSTVEVPPVHLPLDHNAAVQGYLVPGLPPLPAGHYMVEVQAKDNANRAVMSSLSFDVSDQAELSSNYRNDFQLTLKPGRKHYSPGDTAEVLVEAPFAGTALVTVEREKVLRSFAVHLEGNAPSVRIPLMPGDVPNVFVSVTLLRGAEECPHKIKEPDYRIGYCELRVEDPQSFLAVTVSPAATNYLPAQAVEVGVQVSESGGKPASGAEVVLYAVDDGILQLTDYGLPDPHAFFYATRPLTVQTSISLPNLLSEDPEQLSFQNKGYLGGGGGHERVRKNFLACAFWSGALTTDAQGRASARFPAPDSLTRYRIFAVAHTASSHFGSGQSAFQVSKPLVIEPALPGFANIADHLIARGVVQNQTTHSGQVLVTLELDGKARADGVNPTLSRRVSVPANGSAVVEFPVEFVETGDAKWLWKARFADEAAGAFTDAVQSVLPVGHVVPMLRQVILNHRSDSQTNLLALADPQLLAGQGTVTVCLANTRLNDLGETASQLLHYPYGCAEQTGSSLLPWIVLRDIPGMRPLLLARTSTNDMERAIRAGVARLLSMQTESGGLGYWPHAKEPMLWASAYGGMVLALAERHGIAVPRDEFAALLKYLSQKLRVPDAAGSDLSDLCLGLYALALAGHAEPAYHEKIYGLRHKLSSEDCALLALAIAASQGPADMIGELLRPGSLSARVDEERFGCPVREQAIRLLAWIRYRPADATVDRLVSDLMREQKQAHWGTTQGDAWALLALTEYAQQVEGRRQPAEGWLVRGAETIPFRLGDGTNLFTCSLAMTNTAASGLILFNATTNRLYTSVLLEARPRETRLPRHDHGFSIQRRYERLDDNDQPADLNGLRVGDRVLVTLDLGVHESARFVAVDDALPSILEAVNPEFKTQQARSAAAMAGSGDGWISSFREIRKDRCLYFADCLHPGNYTLRYVARVRAAGNVTAPPAKVEEMYHPERYGLSGTQGVVSQAMQ